MRAVDSYVKHIQLTGAHCYTVVWRCDHCGYGYQTMSGGNFMEKMREYYEKR
jgi:hypothetical protein